MNSSKATLQNLILAYHDELLRCLGEYHGQDRQIDFGWLDRAVYELYGAAEAAGDKELALIVDDMFYVIAETNMGAEGKGRSVLPELLSKINRYRSSV